MTEPYSLVIKRSAEKELKAVPQVTSSGSSIAFEAWPNSLGRRDAKNSRANPNAIGFGKVTIALSSALMIPPVAAFSSNSWIKVW